MFWSSSCRLLVNMMRIIGAIIAIPAVVATAVNDQYCKVLIGMDDSLCVDGLCLVHGIPKYPCTDNIIDQSSQIYYELSKILREIPSLTFYFPETYPEYLFSEYKSSVAVIGKQFIRENPKTIKELFNLEVLVPLKDMNLFETGRKDYLSFAGAEEIIGLQNSYLLPVVESLNARRLHDDVIQFIMS